jgi:hypothetical protein
VPVVDHVSLGLVIVLVLAALIIGGAVAIRLVARAGRSDLPE